MLNQRGLRPAEASERRTRSSVQPKTQYVCLPQPTAMSALTAAWRVAPVVMRGADTLRAQVGAADCQLITDGKEKLARERFVASFRLSSLSGEAWRPLPRMGGVSQSISREFHVYCRAEEVA
jgi:hypothetical protein